jgi:hypothetical protein
MVLRICVAAKTAKECKLSKMCHNATICSAIFFPPFTLLDGFGGGLLTGIRSAAWVSGSLRAWKSKYGCAICRNQPWMSKLTLAISLAGPDKKYE